MNAEALLSQNPPGKGGKPGTWKLRVWVRDQPYLKPRRVRLGLGRARSLTWPSSARRRWCEPCL